MDSPKIVINGLDDVARRKHEKQNLSNRVEASLEEFGFFKSLTKTVAHYTGETIKKAASSVVEEVAKAVIPGHHGKSDSKGSEFDDKDHPRGPDGRFVEAPQGTPGSQVYNDKNAADADAMAKAKAEESYNAQLNKWAADKDKFNADEIAKANKKIHAINSGELAKATKAMTEARNALKNEHLSEEDVQRESKKFADAVKKVTAAKNKIKQIKPQVYKVAKPKK